MKMAAFWPMCGIDYQPGKGMLLVGRATNGWPPQFMLREGGKLEEVERIVAEASNPGFGMEWVTDLSGPAAATGRANTYNTNMSPFWRTAHQVAEACKTIQHPEKWSGSLAWSNLYKLAPANGGNPSWAQCSAQQKTCAELLKLEIEAFDPAVVIVVAGGDWWDPFNEALGKPTQPHDGEYVEATGKDRRRWVVTCRPEERPESAFVAEVCQVLTA
jgi:hypothetical protein